MKIYAVIVCYKPCLPKLKNLCDQLEISGVQVLLIDNSEASKLSNWGCESKSELICLNENFGIAFAQNIGIRRARELGADAIVFFDQDSIIGANYVSTLVAGVDVDQPGVFGPVAIDEESGFEYPCYTFNRWGYPSPVFSGDHKSNYTVDLLISSGSLATSATFDIVGAMDESLFIDYVDYVWCMRCRANSISINVNPNLRMKHSVGLRSIDIGPFKTFVHSYNRSYYKVRNPLLLIRNRYVPLLFSSKEIVTAISSQLIQLIFVKNRIKYFHIFLKGIYDGLFGIGGKKR